MITTPAMVFLFILAIIALSMSVPLSKIWSRHLREMREADRSGAADVEAELAELRDRVEVLERIVTDERRGLDREFDRLEGENGGRNGSDRR